MADKTFAELEAQADAMIKALTAQRNHSLDQVVNLLGQVAILEVRLQATESKLADAVARVEVLGASSGE